MTLRTYLPQDRLRALSLGTSLPDRTSGSVLFADISGFTALTESLRESLGPRQGAEKLSKQLEAAYSALIAEVKKFGGRVIGFAGDAMFCWFDERRIDSRQQAKVKQASAVSAVAAAFGMQSAIESFPSLELKVSVATGPARRLVEGQIERALALLGLARRHPAWRGNNQGAMDMTLAEWNLDPAIVEAGLAKGVELDWETTLQELLRT